MTQVEIHSLVEKDPETRTGKCSICGLVGIAKSGRGFMCGEKKKAVDQAWRERNPERSAANRRRKSDHQLFAHDYVANTATCTKCGPVAMTPWGRGNACANLAAERRRVQETEPQKPCQECWLMDGSRVYLVAGRCPRCTDPRRLDTGKALRDAESRASELDGMPDGFSVVDLEHYDAEDMPPGYENAVPGWKTIGTYRPWSEV